jgi:hypothetical protein
VGLRAGLDTANTKEKKPLPLPGIEVRSSGLWSDTILTELPKLVKYLTYSHSSIAYFNS